VAISIGTSLARARLELREPQPNGKIGFTPGAFALDVLEFDFNPKDYKTALSSTFKAEPSKDKNAQAEYTGTDRRTLDVEMFLDATDDLVGDVSRTVDRLLNTVRPTAKSAGSPAPHPPIVMFCWGTSKPFIGFVKSVSVTYNLFRSDGRPVRATCAVSMQELAPSPPPQNPTSGALDANRGHTVVLGDSLASIANAEYGTPTMWRSIAIANRLEDPFNLRVGHQLLLPSPAAAAAMA
jgi:nucleoid-associated protein YgaU